MTHIFFYILILIISYFFSVKKEFRFLTIFFIFLQMSLFLIPLRRIILNFFQDGVSIGRFLIIVFIPLLVLISGKFFKNNSNFIKKIFQKVTEEIYKSFNNIIYFNKGMYYFFNQNLIKIEKIFNKKFNDPQKIAINFVVIPNVLVIIFLIGETFLLNYYFFSFLIFLLNLIIYRFLFVTFTIIEKQSKNSINYNFNTIEELNFKFQIIDKESFKNVIFNFLNSSKINDFVFADDNFKENHLLEKYKKLCSILHFSKNWLTIQIL